MMKTFIALFIALISGVAGQATAVAQASAGISTSSSSVTSTAHPTVVYYKKPEKPSPKPVYYKKPVKPSPKPVILTKKGREVKPSPKPVTIKIVQEPSPAKIDTKKEKPSPEPVAISVVPEPSPAPKTKPSPTPQSNPSPSPLPKECTTIAAAAIGTPSLSTLVSALQAVNLTDALSDPEFIGTVLAPTNAAFTKLLRSLNTTVEIVLADPQLPNILKYHVIGGAAAKAADLTDGSKLTTLLGQELTVDLSDGVKFVGPSNSGSVKVADIEACEAVVHIIDAVLVPDLNAIET